MRCQQKEQYYFVCDGCTSKFFSDNPSEMCPRCCALVISTERLLPPWQLPAIELTPIVCSVCRHYWREQAVWRQQRIDGFDSFFCPNCGTGLRLNSHSAVVAAPDN